MYPSMRRSVVFVVGGLIRFGVGDRRRGVEGDVMAGGRFDFDFFFFFFLSLCCVCICVFEVLFD